MPRSRISPRASAIIAITLTLLIRTQSIEAQQAATGDVKPLEAKPVEQRLTEVEKRLDLILQQLEELRRSQPQRPQPAATALEDFRTVKTALASQVKREAPPAPTQVPFLGVVMKAESGRLAVAEIALDSPASAAGLLVGDIVRQIDGQPVAQPDAFKELLRSHDPGDPLHLTVARDQQLMELTATLAPLSRPLSSVSGNLLRGLSTSEQDDGLKIDRVQTGTRVADAGLRSGDLVVHVDDLPVSAGQRLSELLAEKVPGSTVRLGIRRDDKDTVIELKLPDDDSDAALYGRDGRIPPRWKKDVYKLAAVIIEFSDVEHNAKVTPEEWEKALFSRGTYNERSVTGQRVFGSMNDYYVEQSYGAFRVEGKVFEPIKIDRKRADYSADTGNNRSRLLVETLDKLQERDGKDVLDDFDGLCFIYAGGRVQTNRGGLYWPHRSSFTHKGKRWAYFISSEGGSQMSSISVYAHEFGHMLGLPDLYARPENPGSEGVGVWCAMSNQNGNGRPQHFCAWSKEQLGWIQPTVIDPTVKQKLILSGVEDSAQEVFKVLIRPDGSEYLLLENRRRWGFDTDLPADGLLIWHVVDGKPLLEESHGVIGPFGPRTFLGSVPYPSKSNTAFTPYTTPSSKPQKGAGWPVHITNITRWPDGRISFYIGYEYL